MMEESSNSSSDSVELQYPMVNGNGYGNEDGGPTMIEIVEQPQARGFRFRYECEGPSHGGLQGEKSERYRKTVPSIRVRNFDGPCKIVVTLVTDEQPVPRPHAHKLVGKNCNNGVCTLEVKSASQLIQFNNLCVQHVTRKKASEVLEQRILESIRLDKMVKQKDLNHTPELTSEELLQAKNQAERQAKDMQLNVVRLCFQAYLRDENGAFVQLLPSVISTPIYDSKSPGANALKICRMDKYGGCCTGNEEVFLLCEKVQKDDIQVRFIEQDDDGNVIWESFGNFGPFDVHRQYAIVFKTPPYRDPNIDRAVNVLIMLQRKSDQENSDPKSFTYYPQNFDKEDIDRKRKKPLPSFDNNRFGGPGSSFGGASRAGRNMASQEQTNGQQNGGIPDFNNLSNFNAQVHIDNRNRIVQPGHPIQVSQGQNMFQGQGQGQMNGFTPQYNSMLDAHSVEMDCFPYFDNVAQIPMSVPTTVQDIYVKPQPEPIPEYYFGCNDYNLAHGLTPRGGTGGQVTAKEETNFLQDIVDGSSVQALRADAGMDEVDGGMQSQMTRELTKALPIIEQSTKVLECSAQTSGAVSSSSSVITSPVAESASPVSERVISPGIERVSSPVISRSSLSPVVMETVKPAKIETRDCETQTEKDASSWTAERTIQALQVYASTGDVRCLLVVQRYLLTISDINGDLPLHLALINNKFEVFQNLLDVMVTLPDYRRRVNAYNHHLQTPLHIAVVTNQPYAVDLLIRAGGDPAMVDRNGNTPAHLAVIYGADDCLKALLHYIKPGATQKCPFPELNIKNFDGFTTVHLAAQQENLNAIKLLNYGKADMNIPDGKSGRTPLHHSVEADDLSIAGFLILEAGANINSKRFDGNTPLHIACGRENVGMVALLMAGGADPEMENDEPVDSESEEDVLDGGQEREEAVESAENGENNGDTKSLRGLAPADFTEDDRILRILRGEPYSSLSQIQKEAETKEYEETTQMMTSLRLSSGYHTESGIGSIGMPSIGKSDMEKIDYLTRLDLSKLLDPHKPGSDWLALADRLGLRQMVEGHGKHSPTRLLLTCYEECGGTVDRLLRTLKELHREDAINVIKNQEPPGPAPPLNQKGMKEEELDSGLPTDSGLPSDSMSADAKKSLKT